MISKLKNDLCKNFGCNFKISETKDIFEIIYDDETLKNNDEFLDKVMDICEKYLNEEQFWKLAISYDYLEEIICLEKKLTYTNEFETNQVKSVDFKKSKYEIEFLNNKDDIKLKGSKLITSFFKGITKNLKLIFESSNDIENRQDFLCVEGNRKVFNSVMEF
ncbi:hypothetical protein ACRTAL_002017 [Clostridium perfringens]|uniref:hypothetical protein n=1 Tax=Clostridium perfringens TaxID=1502 RepID=UPI0024BC5032|nr:hypothetical protein [Clostridium perfringens]MDK0532972.1 hypothetical protein [Clostridium perfringens]MDK0713462.1 hypothetical protein [Clostridium perfringens]MDM0630698.1 hypothetical protein [Clostridium perfringens]MDM0642627.1 hypothetical protein [Clostridium perfringens]MDU2231341.1 hypothetical protein [Clostridium perfringens]